MDIAEIVPRTGPSASNNADNITTSGNSSLFVNYVQTKRRERSPPYKSFYTDRDPITIHISKNHVLYIGPIINHFSKRYFAVHCKPIATDDRSGNLTSQHHGLAKLVSKGNIAPDFNFEVGPNLAKFYDARPLALAIASFIQSPRTHPTAMASQENQSSEPERECAEETGLKLVLYMTQALFENRNTLPERSFEKAMGTAKKMLWTTEKHKWIRDRLGTMPSVWKAFADTFNAAVPALEAQSFVTDDPAAANTNGSSSTLMALNHNTLMKDLERVDDLVKIGRNILASVFESQDLAGESGIDQHMLKLVDVCVRVTARGYDGEAGSRSETHWANVVGLYKKLLVSCLQFLHNLVQKNEKRKLLLWLDLFANSKTADQYFTGNIDPRKDNEVIAAGGPSVVLNNLPKRSGLSIADDLLHNALNAVQDSENPITDMRPEEAARIASQVMSTMDGLMGLTLEQGHQNQLEESGAKDGVAHQTSMPLVRQPWKWTSMTDPNNQTDPHATPRLDELPAVRDPQSAATTLQQAKDQLMARLQEPLLDHEDGEEQDVFPGSENEEDGDVRGSDVAANGSVGEENNDHEYRGPGDQERGLLTDIPLVLSPSEIEALPLIIQLGIVGDMGRSHGTVETQDMQSVRCNILLAQESGRNLLRELLIFIAAWDLQDDDFYFKIMMSIMESILKNGLMPFAYQAFAEVKDIVSPAQSMVIKILTQIFRGKQGLPPGSRGLPEPIPNHTASGRVDLLIVRYIFTTFRQGIIPETCALIYLQGQIRAGAALPEDFPLNLWDMERVYEGVYQFLEFFAVLTESEEWKNLLVQWEIVSELVTLLRELDGSIPKAPLGPLPQTNAEAAAVSSVAETEASSQTHVAPAPVAVERPYDQAPPDPSWPAADYADGTASETPSAAIDNQDPSDFEWRNLKKLVVLVLSSLVWKSPIVQDQIRKYGGVEMVLACCNFDSNNPYIREHAIMCLRFLLEGNRENQEIVRVLEPRRGVPDEVLDKRGYETYIDDKGKVGLRAKEGTGP